MVIKITEKCSMGCSHCMNNALPTGKHMSFDTFKDVIKFQKQYGGAFCIISGGEPGEHPKFLEFFKYALQELPGVYFTIATNGTWMPNHYDDISNLIDVYDNIMFQVTTVDEYYPTKIDLSNPVYSLPNVIVCREIENMYGQGRALTNHLEYHNKCSRCMNLRLVAHQCTTKNFGVVLGMLAVKGLFCTPTINIHGDIKLGESDLCPICSSIYKSEQEIMNDILNFHCHQCDHINKNLSKQCLDIIGGEV